MKKTIFFSILIIMLCFIITGCKKENNKKEKLVENIDYTVRRYNGSYLDLSERGYYIDTLNEPDAPYLYIICMGRKYTGGYSLKIKEVYKIGDKTEVIVNENIPPEESIVTQVITYPTIVIEFPKAQENIVIKNTEGVEFPQLSDY